MIALLISLAAAADLTGVWRVDLHLVHDLQIPVLGKSQSDSYTVQLWRVADGVLVNEHCSIRAVTRTRIGKPTIPPAFVHNIRHATVPIVLDGERFHADMGIGSIGFTGDVVPTMPDEPSVIDHEGDGKPGATMTVWAPLFGDVEVYVAQRTHLVLDGTVDGDEVTGRASQLLLEQTTLGAANRLFARHPVVAPMIEESTFRMSRVPTGATCADVALAPLSIP